MLSTPEPLVHGALSVDLDPAVFDDISSINVFSAAGDQTGMANIQGDHADLFFTSNSGGIGRLPGLPVIEITVPVLASASAGATGQVKLQETVPWRDLQGNQYAMSFQSAGVVIGAGMSIQSVRPGAGPLPAGTVVRINGQGFTDSTSLRLDDVNWSDLRFAGPQVLTFTVNSPTDLEGKLLVLTDSNGATTRYYSTLSPTAFTRDSNVPSGLQPIIPRVPNLHADFISPWFAFENDSQDAIDVALIPAVENHIAHGPPPEAPKTITVPPGAIQMGYYPGAVVVPNDWALFSISASAPIRAIQWQYPGVDNGPAFPFPRATVNTGVPYCQPTFLLPFSFLPGVPALTPNYWNVVPNDPPPPPFTCRLDGPSTDATDYTLLTGADDGGSWLTASAAPDPGEFTVTLNPDGLGVGVHNGIVRVVQNGSPAASTPVMLSLNVSPAAMIQTATPNADPSGAITIVSGTPNVPVTVSSSDDWLIVTPSQGTTPLTISTGVNAAALPNQHGYISGTVTVRAPGNTLTFPRWYFVANQDVIFSTPVGSAQILSQEVGLSAPPQSLEVSTTEGGDWLTATQTNSVIVYANPSGLAEGKYEGTVTVHFSDLPSDSETFSVILFVWGKQTPSPTVSPSSIEITDQPVAPNSIGVGWNDLGGSGGVMVTSGSVALPVAASFEAEQGLRLNAFGCNLTPCILSINGGADYPGVYHGSIRVTVPPDSGNSVLVPVTVTVKARPSNVLNPPRITGVVNAASLLSGPVAPGEMISIFDFSGPDATSTNYVGTDGKLTTASYGNRVLFNGVPAPITYMSPTQINAIVPYEVAGSSTVNVELDVSTIHTPAWSIPVAPAAPGIFTQDGSGLGSGNILNADGSLNAPAHPASRGSTIQIFVTGVGQTNPEGITGEIVTSDGQSPILTVNAEIGGAEAKVFSTTSVPGSPAGMFRVTAEVPPTVPSGNVPVSIRIGSSSSQTGVTVSVQ